MANGIATATTRKGLRVGLRPRLFVAFIVVSFLGVGISALFVDRTVRQSARSQVHERLTYEVVMLGQITANALFGPIDPTDTSLAGVVKQLADAVHTNLSILATDGTVVADSDEPDVSKVPKQSQSEEIVEALASGTGSAVRESNRGPRMFVAQTIVRDGKALGIARASVPMDVVEEVARTTRHQMSLGGVIAALVAATVALLTAFGITRVIQRVADGARKIGKGDLSHRVDVTSNDEIGDLADALNDMSARLQLMIGKLDQRNRDMRVVLDNVAQGLVTVDKNGVVAQERSKAIDHWFASPGAGTKLWDLFTEMAPATKASLSMGWEQVFDGFLPIELTLSQLPRRVRNGDAYFELGYEPIAGTANDLESLLVVVSDVTSVVAGERSEAEQREQMSLFAAVAKDRNAVSDFLKETGKIVEFVIGHGADVSSSVTVKRGVHTIKGNCSLFGLTSVSTICHEIETRLAETEACGEPAAITASDLLELKAGWGSLIQRSSDLLGNIQASAVDVTAKEIAQLVVAIQTGQGADSLIRMIAMWSMEPVEKRLARLADQARQLAARVGKPGVTVDVHGSNVRLPADRFATLWNTLSHAIRNALDHGIETADERRVAGKPEHGRLTLSATEAGDMIVIEIADDGRGIDWPKVREKALKLGLPAATESDLCEALFTDGVSTRDEAGDYSGRGVGMSVLRGAVLELGGRVELESSLGLGTRLRFWFNAPGSIDSVAKIKAALSIPPQALVCRPRPSVTPRTSAAGEGDIAETHAHGTVA